MFLKDPFTGNPSIPFTLYAMECEGEIDTYTGKHNKIVKNLRQRAQYELITKDDVFYEANAAGLGDLTYQEVEEILNEVRNG